MFLPYCSADDHFRDEDEPALETLDDGIVQIVLMLKSDRNRLEDIGAHYQKKSLRRARRHVVEGEDVFQAPEPGHAMLHHHVAAGGSPAASLYRSSSCRDAQSLEDRLFDDLGLWNVSSGGGDGHHHHHQPHHSNSNSNSNSIGDVSWVAGDPDGPDESGGDEGPHGAGVMWK